MKTKYYKREWLNTKEGSAHITSNVESDYGGLYAGVDITDCNRKVALDFAVTSKRQYAERLKKLDKLIKHLTDFREKFVDAKVLIK